MSLGVLPVDASGLRVLVTAAGSGIGRVIARSFRARGADVYICDIEEDMVRQAMSEEAGLRGRPVDVGDPVALDAMFDDALAAMGGLDVLVNNAGIAGPTARVEDIAPDDLRRTLQVNVEAQFHCSARAVPVLRDRGGGSIMNIGSVAGRLGFAMRTPYAASKWAIVGFTKSLALEAGREGVRVNAILPGHVDSPRFRRVAAAKAAATGVTEEEMAADMVAQTALGSTVEMQDIANMALYLASPFGAAITGQAISVCAGVEMMR